MDVRGGLIWAGSGLIHGAVWWALQQLPVPSPMAHTRTQVSFELRVPAPVRRDERADRPLPHTAGSATLAHSGREQELGGLAPSRGRAQGPRTDAQPAGSQPEPDGQGPSPGGRPHSGPINLFPNSVLCQTVGCADVTSSQRYAQAQLAERDAQGAAERAVQAGLVAPIWREVERDMQRSFRPNIEAVTRQNRGLLALRQLTMGARAAPENSDTGWLGRRNALDQLMAEKEAAYQAYNQPAVGREAITEVEIDEEGEVRSVRVIKSSGSPALDDEAIRATGQAVRVRGPRGETGSVVARYGLRAEVATNLPKATTVSETNGAGVHAAGVGLSGTFDETTGRIGAQVPFAKRLVTRVRLISVRNVATRAKTQAPPPARPEKEPEISEDE